MGNNSKRCALTACVILAMGLTACGGSGSGAGGKTGRLSLGVSDGPIHDADKVCVAFHEIEFKKGSETTVVPLDPVANINLLDFQGMNAAPLLFDYELPAGDYQWLRLGVNAVLGGAGGTGNDSTVSTCQGTESYLAMQSDIVHNLYVPSGAQSGLKLVGGFTVPVNGTANFTAEFDLMKSVTAPRGLDPDVILRPTIRLVNNVEVGTLTGMVINDPAAEVPVIGEGCAPSVYLFNDGVMPNAIDMEGVDANDPVATALVEERVNELQETEYHYTIGFLLAGSYEAAFTCDGVSFLPAAGKEAVIAAQQVTTVDFP